MKIYIVKSNKGFSKGYKSRTEAEEKKEIENILSKVFHGGNEKFFIEESEKE